MAKNEARATWLNGLATSSVRLRVSWAARRLGGTCLATAAYRNARRQRFSRRNQTKHHRMSSGCLKPGGRTAGSAVAVDVRRRSCQGLTSKPSLAVFSTGGALESSPQRELWVGGFPDDSKLRRSDRRLFAAPPELVSLSLQTPGSRPGLLSSAAPQLRSKTRPGPPRFLHSGASARSTLLGLRQFQSQPDRMDHA